MDRREWASSTVQGLLPKCVGCWSSLLARVHGLRKVKERLGLASYVHCEHVLGEPVGPRTGRGEVCYRRDALTVS